jgi:predicted MFS family arabinose efflux permease
VTIGASIFLIAVGAILRYATNLHVSEISIDTVGLILMIAGVAGLILGFVQDRMARRSRREVLVEDRRDPRQPPYEDPRQPPY